MKDAQDTINPFSKKQSSDQNRLNVMNIKDQLESVFLETSPIQIDKPSSEAGSELVSSFDHHRLEMLGKDIMESMKVFEVPHSRLSSNNSPIQNED